MSSEPNGADALCAALRAAGVDTVFGVPGTQTVAFYEALRRSGIRTVTASHELAAAFMAQGYHRASGRLAAVSAIPGPGFAFTLAALAEAKLDSSALVLLTGQPPVCPQGRRRSQTIDQRAMAGPIVKGVMDISSAVEVDGAIRRACGLALVDEPGPVLVQVAAGVFGEVAPEGAARPAVADAPPAAVPGLQEALAFVTGAKQVLFYAGQGAAGSAEALRRVVSGLGAVVATTPSGRGLVPEDDDRLLPLDSTGDLRAFNSVAAECDAIVVIGAALAENGSVGFGLDLPPERLVRVDVSEAVLATPPAARFSLRMSAAEFLDALETAIAAGPSAPRGFDAVEARALRGRLVDRRSGGPSDARIGGGTARDFFAGLRRGLPADGCLVLDSGMHQLLARRHFVVTGARGLLFPSDFQSMGFGLPAAIGAKLAIPDRAVVALIGDGGLAMTGLELITAVRLRVGLPVLVFDDAALGLIRLDQLLVHGTTHGTKLGGLDFESLADAVGCAFSRADASSIEAEARSALGRDVPTLIVVPVRDAPALTRARANRAVRQSLKSLLGPRVLEAYRRFRGRGRGE